MSNLEKYVKKIEEYKKQNPDLTEVELVRYVYMDLGNRFSFDLNFAFGNSNTKKRIYRNSGTREKMEETFETNIGVCKDMARILAYVLSKFDIDIKTMTDGYIDIPNEHVYNAIRTKEGLFYTIDLQRDLKNIRAHARTSGFGLSFDDKPIFTREQLEQMDRKLGFVSDEHYYSDDYLYLLKQDMGFYENFGEKVQFVLENIEAYDREKTGYAERILNHEKILKKLFSESELRKIHFIDCYKEDKNKQRDYYECIAVEPEHKQTDMYIYSTEENKYCKMSMKEFARKVKEGLVNMQGIPGLKRAIRILNQEEGR